MLDISVLQVLDSENLPVVTKRTELEAAVHRESLHNFADPQRDDRAIDWKVSSCNEFEYAVEPLDG
jgi:hypothetical protein